MPIRVEHGPNAGLLGYLAAIAGARGTNARRNQLAARITSQMSGREGPLGRRASDVLEGQNRAQSAFASAAGAQASVINADKRAQVAQQQMRMRQQEQQKTREFSREQSQTGFEQKQALQSQDFDQRRALAAESVEMQSLSRADQQLQQQMQQLQQMKPRLDQKGRRRFDDLVSELDAIDENRRQGVMSSPRDYLYARSKMLDKVQGFNWQHHVEPPGSRPGDFKDEGPLRYLVTPEGPQLFGFNPNASQEEYDEYAKQFVRPMYDDKSGEILGFTEINPSQGTANFKEITRNNRSGASLDDFYKMYQEVREQQLSEFDADKRDTLPTHEDTLYGVQSVLEAYKSYQGGSGIMPKDEIANRRLSDFAGVIRKRLIDQQPEGERESSEFRTMNDRQIIEMNRREGWQPEPAAVTEAFRRLYTPPPATQGGSAGVVVGPDQSARQAAGGNWPQDRVQGAGAGAAGGPPQGRGEQVQERPVDPKRSEWEAALARRGVKSFPTIWSGDQHVPVVTSPEQMAQLPPGTLIAAVDSSGQIRYRRTREKAKTRMPRRRALPIPMGGR